MLSCRCIGSCVLDCFFFFQAEDGIRDYKVTGVQTCALPISRVSLGVGGLAVLLSIAIGVAVGAVAGHWGGPVRTLLLGITDFALALPRVVLLLDRKSVV